MAAPGWLSRGTIRDKAVETIVQQDLDHIADALYRNNTAQSRNRQVYTPIIAVLHRAGIERRFKRPKGWQGKKSKSFLEYDQAFDLLDAADAIDREFGLLCYTLYRSAHRRSAQPEYETAQSQFAAWHALSWENQKRRSGHGAVAADCGREIQGDAATPVATEQDYRESTAAQRRSRDVTARCRRAIS